MTANRTYNSGSTWPRRRLVTRSIISSTLPIGWTWAAMTALIPYFWLGHGAGSSADVLFGTTRATWLSLHVWSSIAMAILTIAHMVLNRRGVARSYRVVGGVPNKASSAAHGRRGFAWVGAALLIAVSVGGGYWFATVDDSHSASRDRQITAEDGPSTVDGYQGSGNGRR